ncbi:MAG: hypothetical protein ACRDIY_07940, partial [Chloroflexota bacterium]
MGRLVISTFALVALIALAGCEPTTARPPTAPSPGQPTGALVQGAPHGSPSPTAPAAEVLLAPSATPIVPTATPVPPTSTPVPPTATSDPPTPTVAPTPGQAVSWLDNVTLLGAYGRAFGVAPILGRLGMYDNTAQMASDMEKFSTSIRALNGGKPVLIEIHLIYALAMPCEANSDCLFYLEGADPHIVDDYIKPAQQRGWLVVLDTQLGRSDPVTQVQRMIDKGYLKYDNVEVALDPEFHVVPGHLRPGIPVGTITAQQVNDAQALLDEYVQKEHLPHRKILMVHQFGDKLVNDGVPFMIQDKTDVKDYDNVDLA